MTGLNVEKEHIIEMACLITDEQLNMVAQVRESLVDSKHLKEQEMLHLLYLKCPNIVEFLRLEIKLISFWEKDEKVFSQSKAENIGNSYSPIRSRFTPHLCGEKQRKN